MKNVMMISYYGTWSVRSKFSDRLEEPEKFPLPNPPHPAACSIFLSPLPATYLRMQPIL